MSTEHALPAELTVYTVSELHPRFMAWVTGDAAMPSTDDDGVLRVQASGVSEVDAAGLQLLVSMARYLAARGEQLVLADASPRLIEACAALGAPSLLASDHNDKTPAGASHAH
jgi:ABC-type transporter Mla MlaB component